MHEWPEGSDAALCTRRSRRVRTVATWLAASAIALSTATLGARPFTVADDIAFQEFGDPYSGEMSAFEWSPDSSFVLVNAVSGNVETNRPVWTGHVYAASALGEYAASRILRTPAEPWWAITLSRAPQGPVIKQQRWLPDSSGIALLAPTESRTYELLLADVRHKTLSRLTAPGEDITAFDIVSPSTFVYARRVAAEQGATTASEGIGMVGTGRSLLSLLFPGEQSIRTDRSEVWLVANGRKSQILYGDYRQALVLAGEGLRTLTLAPDGRRILAAMPVESVPKEWTALFKAAPGTMANILKTGLQKVDSGSGEPIVNQYAIVELATGVSTRVGRGPTGTALGWWGGTARPAWSADGELLALPNAFPDDASHDTPVNERLRPCIAVYTRANHATACVDKVRSSDASGRYESEFRAPTRMGFRPRRSQPTIDIEYSRWDGSRTTVTFSETVPGLWRESPEVGKDRPLYVTVSEDLNRPPAVTFALKRRERSQILWDPNASLSRLEGGIASEFRWRTPSGDSGVGGLYLPTSPAQNGAYPLVIQTHGFIEHSYRPHGLFPTAFAARELAAAGIAVLQVRDCGVYGTPTEGPCNVANYTSAVRALKNKGLVDESRVGLVGFSRTCFYVLETLTSGALPVAAASITEGVNVGYLQYLFSVDINANQAGREAESVVGAAPFGAGLREWLNRSPTFNLDRIETPLQVVALGPRSQLLEMWEPYAGLRSLGKPVDLILMHEPGTHVLSNPLQRIVSQQGTVDWFRFWLQGYEDPDPAKADQYQRWERLCDLQVRSNPDRPAFCVPSKSTAAN